EAQHVAAEDGDGDRGGGDARRAGDERGVEQEVAGDDGERERRTGGRLGAEGDAEHSDHERGDEEGMPRDVAGDLRLGGAAGDGLGEVHLRLHGFPASACSMRALYWSQVLRNVPTTAKIDSDT